MELITGWMTFWEYLLLYALGIVNNGHSQAHGNASSCRYPTGHEENTA